MDHPAASPAISHSRSRQLVTPRDFIRFFESISQKRWCVGSRSKGDRRCAIGHCLARRPGGSWSRLSDLLMGVAKINDGDNPVYQQPTPRARVLAALRDRLPPS